MASRTEWTLQSQASRRSPAQAGSSGNGGARNTRKGVPSEMYFATTWGRTGFDGDAEAGIAGGCVHHPENGQLIN